MRTNTRPDVGERWYPTLLQQIRQQQADEAAAKQQDVSSVPQVDSASIPPASGQPIEAH